jgi:hypothetical protein
VLPNGESGGNRRSRMQAIFTRAEGKDTKTVYYQCEMRGFESDPKPRHEDSGLHPHVCQRKVKVHIVQARPRPPMEER